MSLFELIKVVILGIVEGITEWLPISSTGHLYLLNEFINLNADKEFTDLFMYVVQLGAILAVLVIFWNRLWPFHGKGKAPAESFWQTESDNKLVGGLQRFTDNYVDMEKIILWLKIVVSCLPAMLLIPVNDIIDKKLMVPELAPFVISAALILYGILFIVIENYNKKRKRVRIRRLSEITWGAALLVGIFQMLAVIPGTSRSGSTIIGGIVIGMSRRVAAEYTFFLAIPVMFGVSFIKILQFGFTFTGTEIVYLLLGMIVAFVVSLFAIKFLMGYVKKHDFKVFGWYRIVLGILVIGFFLGKTLLG